MLHERIQQSASHSFGPDEPPFALAMCPLTKPFATPFTTTLRPNPRISIYTSTTLRTVPPASATFSAAVDPYLCETAAETEALPASMTRAVDASNDVRTIAAGYATRASGRNRAVSDWGAGGGLWCTKAGGGFAVRERRLISRSIATVALLLSFTASSVTVWTRVRSWGIVGEEVYLMGVMELNAR
jgi:hypothetical protein